MYSPFASSAVIFQTPSKLGDDITVNTGVFDDPIRA
jgi:hypothetical protein